MFDAVFDMAFDLCNGTFIDQWPLIRAGRKTRPDGKRANTCRQLPGKGFINAGLDQNAICADAGLT